MLVGNAKCDIDPEVLVEEEELVPGFARQAVDLLDIDPSSRRSLPQWGVHTSIYNSWE